jgi:hypothetical protein
MLTPGLRAATVYRCRGYQNIVDNSKRTLAANPVTIFVLDLSIGHDSRLVHTDATVLDGSSKGDLIGVEVFPARLASDLGGQVAEDVLDRVGAISDAGILRQIWGRSEGGLPTEESSMELDSP